MVDIKNIKLIGLDLDGTLLRSDRKPSKNSMKTLSKLHQKGVIIVIATGRNYTSIPRELFEADCVDYLITSNGACIYDRKGTLLKSQNLSEDAVEKVIQKLKKYDYMVELFIDGKGYISRDKYLDIIEGRITYRVVEYVKNTRTSVEDIYKLARDCKKNIENINIFFDTNEEKTKFFNEISRIENIAITTSFKENIEIGHKLTTKGNGIKWIAEKYNISRENVVCFGDSDNDKSMIIYAGMGVAMENGDDCVKEVADFITKSNDEDGVIYGIDKILKNFI